MRTIARRLMVALAALCAVFAGCGADTADGEGTDGGTGSPTSSSAAAATRNATSTSLDMTDLIRLAKSVYGKTDDTEGACIAERVLATVGAGRSEALLRDAAFEEIGRRDDRALIARAVVDCKDLRRPGTFGVTESPPDGGVTDEQRVCADRWMRDEDRVEVVAMTWESPRVWRDSATYGKWLVATGDCLTDAQVVAVMMVTAGSHDPRLDYEDGRCFAETLIATVGRGEALRIEGRSTPSREDRNAISRAVSACVG